MTEMLWQSALTLAEKGYVPDAWIRGAIRRLCAERLEEESAAGVSPAEFADLMRAGPVAPVPAKANEQHYEVPPAFFLATLGPRLKYSCCHWGPGVETLEDAETEALRITCERAEIANGQRILELGCGWGSLSLWMAQEYPGCRITSVSNSGPQRRFIEERAAERGLHNLEVVTCDMNDFQTDERFDRVVSVEMFEHMRNYEELLRRISGWLEPDGRLFVHIFCHRRFGYEFQTDGATAWMGRHFFTGGIMPSRDVFDHFSRDMRLSRSWAWSGRHYERTANAWLENMDRRRGEVLPVLAACYGAHEAERWFGRWRIFFMACAELWGFAAGQEWPVGHYLLETQSAKSDKAEIGEIAALR